MTDHSDPRQSARDLFWQDRDGSTYRCPGCGRPREFVDAVEVHHRDENKRNADDANLIGLCRRCHQRGEHGRRPQDIPSRVDAPRPHGVDEPRPSVGGPGY